MAYRQQLNLQDMREVSAVFTRRETLESVLEELGRRNLREQVSVMMSDQTQQDLAKPPGTAPEYENNLPEGATVGGLTGGVLGALMGSLMLIGTFAMPAVGLVVSGPLVGALAGGAIGAAGGGLAGALIGAGIPEDHARAYEGWLNERGNVLLLAHVPEAQVDEVRDLFERYGGQLVRVSQTGPVER